MTVETLEQARAAVVAGIDAAMTTLRGSVEFRNAVEELLKGTPHEKPESTAYDFEGLYGRLRSALKASAQPAPLEGTQTLIEELRQRWDLYRRQTPRAFNAVGSHPSEQAIASENKLMGLFIRDLDELLAALAVCAPPKRADTHIYGCSHDGEAKVAPCPECDRALREIHPKKAEDQR